MYGVNKVVGELFCDYYYYKFGVDIWGLCFLGLILYVMFLGGGIMDYVVEIYYEVVKYKWYMFYIDKGIYMDMMYMFDVLNVVI